MKKIIYALVLLVAVSSLLAACGGKEEVQADYSKLTRDNVVDALLQSKWNPNNRLIIEAHVNGKKVEVEAKTALESTQNFEKIKMYIKDDLKELQGFKDIESVEVKYSTLLKDKYGNMKQTHVVTGYISGDDLRQINFDNFYAEDLEGVMEFPFVVTEIK